MSNTRIPRDPSGFSTYINNGKSYLLTDSPVQSGLYIPRIFPEAASAAASIPLPIILKNWQRLWLLPVEMDTWTNFTGQFNTLYEKYSDKKESRTTSIRDNLFKVMDDFGIFAEPILKRIEGNPYVTINDLSVFNIKSGFLSDSNSTRQRTQVTSLVAFILNPLGGGDVRVEARPNSDSKRASKFPGANLEILYKIVDKGEPVPTSVEQLTERVHSTKALHTLHLGTENAGKRVYAACRWVVDTDPSRNGPWGNLQSVVIG